MSEELLRQQEARIQELTNELATVKAKAEEEKSIAAVREAATAAAHKPVTAVPNSVVQEAFRQKIIKTCGGPALYSSLPMSERLKANGQLPASAEEIETSRKLFGRNSSSIEAARLARHNPSQYSRLRTIFREL
jgi:LPS O-antigen subunit length determinant protein (WzzB/FepE family)